MSAGNLCKQQYLSADMLLEQKQNRCECEQRIFEGEGGVLRDSLTKSERVIDKSALKLIEHALNKDRRTTPYIWPSQHCMHLLCIACFPNIVRAYQLAPDAPIFDYYS